MKYTWNQYLSFCKRLCPKDLSFDMLVLTIPFFHAYERNVPHRALMDMIEHQSSLEWRTSEERLETINEFIERWDSKNFEDTKILIKED